MTGRWQCQRCREGEAKIQILGVGGGIKEARQVVCMGCGEADHYLLDLLSRNGSVATQRGKFRWMKEDLRAG